MPEKEGVYGLVANLKKSTPTPKGFDKWSLRLQIAWLKANQKKKRVPKKVSKVR